MSERNVVKVFVSHTSADIAHVRKLKHELESRDPEKRVQIWIYETETGPTRSLGELKFDVEEADFMLVALSNNSVGQEFVQREVGHAVRLARKSPDGRPIVLGVWVDPASPPDRIVVPLRDFDSRGVFGKHDFSTSRYYKLHRPDVDDLGDLYDFIAPHVLFWGHDITDREKLNKTHVWEIYKQFFRNVEERDDPEDILDWLEVEHARRAPDYQASGDTRSDRLRITERTPTDWGSVFGVVQIAGRAVGMIYLTVHVRSGWVFGNYFGVLKSWRVSNRAAYFIEQTRAHAERQFGKLKGVVFEVERYGEDDIARLTEKLSWNRPKLLKTDEETIRSVMRIGLYQRHGVRLLVGPQSRDVVYRQPAMNDLKKGERLTRSWLRKHEWPLWLMVWPFSVENVYEYDMNEILDFLYLDLFGSYYERREGLFRSYGLSYADYLLAIRDEIRGKNDPRAYGLVTLPNSGKDVWRLAVLGGLSIKL